MKCAFYFVLFAFLCLGCTEDSSCPNDFDRDCVDGAYDNHNADVNKNSGPPGGNQYANSGSSDSGKIANGLACTSDDQCESGNCYEGRVCRKRGWGGASSGSSSSNSSSSNSSSSGSSSSNSSSSGSSSSNSSSSGSSSSNSSSSGSSSSGSSSSNSSSSGSSSSNSSSSGKIANGLACTSDDQCESGNCYEGRVCRKQGWGGSYSSGSSAGAVASESSGNASNSANSEKKLLDGSNCDVNSDCQSGVCVSEVCVSASGDTSLSGNKNGLGAKKIGVACSDNLECESGLCHNGTCSGDCDIYGCGVGYYVCRENKCIPTETHGNSCIIDNDCSSIGMYCCNGFCKAGACEVGIDCSKSYSCVNYCNDTPWGTVCSCSKDSECGSDYYCNTNGFSICEHKLPVGGNCGSDVWAYNSWHYANDRCQTGVCYKGSCVVEKP